MSFALAICAVFLIKETQANSTDPDQTPLQVASDQDLDCL